MARKQISEEKLQELKEKHLLFKRFVEPGRLCLIEYGPFFGKICIIVDIITLKRVIVDGPFENGVPRMIIPIKRLRLLDQYVKIKKNTGSKKLKEIVESSKILETFRSSPLGKKMAIRKRREESTDFERFQVLYAKKLLKKKINELKGTTSGAH